MSLPLLGAVLVLGAGLRVAHLGWGLPDYFFPDEAVFFRPAVQIAATGELHTGFTTYPPLSVNLLAATYAVAARARGVRADQLSVSDRVIVGRLVMVAAAVATVGAVAALGATLAGPAAGLVGAFFMAVLPVHVVQSRIISTDVLLTLLVVLALHAALCMQAHPGLPRALLAGALVGLAAGTKYPGALAAAAPGVVCVHALATALRRRDAAGVRRWLALGIAAGAGALAGFTVAYPHWVADADVLGERLAFLRFVAHEVGNDIGRLSPAGGIRGTPIVYQLVILFPAALGVALYPIAMAGVFRLARRATVRETALLAFAAVHFLFFATAQSVFPRYFLPLMPVLVIAAAALLADLAARPGAARTAALAAGGLTAGYTLALAVSLTANTGTEPQLALREAVTRLTASQTPPPRVGYVPNRFGDYTGVRAALRGLPIATVQMLVDPQWLEEERPDVLVVSDIDEIVALRNHPGSATATTLAALAAGELPYGLATDVRVSYLTRGLYTLLDPYFGFSVERGAVGFRVYARQ
jgi:4-amino-4-deoxy-L-arabinose transferase-like glycosyltransferase